MNTSGKEKSVRTSAHAASRAPARKPLADDSAVASPWASTSTKVEERRLKRDAVLKVSAQLFNEYGYHATSLAMIADRLQVTKPTLYYYIQNKEEILFECHRAGIELLHMAVARANKQDVPAPERLRATLLAYASVVLDDFCKCLIRVGEESLPVENRKELSRLRLALDHEFRSIVQGGIDDGSFELCDAKIAAYTLAGALNWTGRWFEADGPLNKEEVALRTTDVLLGGMLKRNKESAALHKPTPRRSTRAKRSGD